MKELKLNIGCGSKLLPEFENLDKYDCGGNIVHDIETQPLPYPDNSVALIHASHVLEHLRDLVTVMNECYRVLEPAGIMHIYVPVFPFAEAFSDPTHVRYFTKDTFTYFTKNTPTGGSIGFNGEFTIVGAVQRDFELEIYLEAVK